MAVLTNYKPGVWVASSDWIADMRRMLKWLGDDDIRTSEALCVRLMGDFTAGMVLHRLLMWLKYATRTDGAIWKSDRAWKAELGLSYAQMKRARQRLMRVVDMWIEKAQGAPTWHYKVNPEALVRLIASTVMRGFLFVKIWFFKKVKDGFTPRRKMDFQQSRKSITTESPTPTKTNSVSDLLIQAGVNHKAAEAFGWLPEAVVTDLISQAEAKREKGLIRRKLGGYVLGMVRQWVKENPNPRPLPHPTGTQSSSDREGEKKAPDYTGWPVAFSEERPTAKDSFKQEEMDLRRPEKSPAAVAWDMALTQLAIQIDRDNFTTWIQGAEVVGFTPPPAPPHSDREGGKARFIIACRSEMAREWCSGPLGRTITRVLRDAWAESPVTIEWVVQAERDNRAVLSA